MMTKMKVMIMITIVVTISLSTIGRFLLMTNVTFNSSRSWAGCTCDVRSFKFNDAFFNVAEKLNDQN